MSEIQRAFCQLKDARRALDGAVASLCRPTGPDWGFVRSVAMEATRACTKLAALSARMMEGDTDE